MKGVKEIKATKGTLPNGGVSAKVFYMDNEGKPSTEDEAEHVLYVEYDKRGREVYSRILQ